MAKKATYIQAKVSGGSTVESFEIVDKWARAAIDSLQASTFTVTEVSDGVEVSDGTNSVIVTNGQDGSDGKSAYESYLTTTSDSPALSEADWVASLHGHNGTNGTNGQDGTIVTVTEVANGVEVSDGTNSVTITNGQDGSDGESAYEIYCRTHSGQDLTEQQWLASLQGQDGTNGSDGTSPTISANSSNTVTYNQSTQQYEVASDATDYIYKLDVSYGSGNQNNFTTPNLMEGASAVLNAVAEIMSQTASVSQQSNGNNE